MTTSPRLGYTELTNGQATPETTVNEIARWLEQMGNRAIVLSKGDTTPPGSPADGDAYILGGSPTGAWAGHAKAIAFYMNTSWEFITPIEGTKAYVQDENGETTYDGSAWSATVSSSSNPTESLIVACSDEATAITTGTGKVTFRMPYAFTLTAVRASVTTAPTGSVLTIDINEGGSSILSTKLTIDASEKTSTTAATPAVISDSSLADDAEITIDFDTVGSTVSGAGVKVYLIGNRT